MLADEALKILGRPYRSSRSIRQIAMLEVFGVIRLDPKTQEWQIVNRLCERFLEQALTQDTAPLPTPTISPDTSSVSLFAPSLPQSSGKVTIDFQLEGMGIKLIWRSPLIGREVTPFVMPYGEDALPVIIRALDALQYPNYPIPQTPAQQRHFTFNKRERAILRMHIAFLSGL